MRNQKNKTLLILGLVVLLALAVRIIRVGNAPFEHADDINLVWGVTFFYPRTWVSLLPNDPTGLPNPVLMLFNERGPLAMAIGTLTMALYGMSNFNITEAMWDYPFAVLSALTAYIVYLWIRDRAGKAAGVLAAALIAVFPLHVCIGRISVGASTTLGFGLNVALLLFYERYLHDRKPRDLYASAMLLFLSMVTEPGFAPVGGVIVYMGWAHHYLESNEFKSRARALLHSLLRWPFVAAVIGATGYHLVAFWSMRGGLIGDILLSSSHVETNTRFLGFFGTLYLQEMMNNLGVIALGLVTICVLPTLKYVWRFDPKGFPTVWGVASSFIFLFLVGRPTLSAYYVWVIGPFLMAASIGVLDIVRSKRVIGKTLGFLLLLILLLETISLFLPRNVPDVLNVGTYYRQHFACGSCRRDSGIKTAAWWIRRNAPNDVAVFCDANGDGYLDLPVCMYYIHRPIIGVYGRSVTGVEENYHLLVRDEIPILVVEPENAWLLDNLDISGRYCKAVEIRERGRETLRIYVLGSNCAFQDSVLDVERINILYDQMYTKFSDVMDISWITTQRQ